MRNSHRLLRSAMFTAAALAASGAVAEPSPTGVWIDDQGRGGIEIKDCAGKLCGHLVWFKDSGEAKNCGKQILGDVAPVGRNTWDNGWIYDPEKKQRFDLELKPLSADTLQVKGYAGIKFLNKTMVWKRAPANLARCDSAKIDSTKVDPVTRPPASSEAQRAAEPASPPPSQAATPPPSGAAPAEAQPPKANRTARADTVPSEQDDAQDKSEDKTSDEAPAKGEKKDCKLEVPYVTLTFPCPD